VEEMLVRAVMLSAAVVGLVGVCVGGYLQVAKRFRGATTIKLGAFGEIKTPHPGLAIIFLGLFLFVCAVGLYSQSRKTREIEEVLDTLMTDTAKSLYREFHLVIDSQARPITPESFRRPEELIVLLKRLDPENGHALYYEGEIDRFEDRCQQATDAFLRYVDIVDSLPHVEKDGDISQTICYQRAHGYCRQRTGWVLYLLAHRLYWQGLEEPAPSIKKERFKDALKKLDGSRRAFYPSVFNNLIPTNALDEAVNAEIRALDGGDPVTNRILPERAC